MTRTGGCHCGAVRFEAQGEPKFVSNCHCKDCRRATGAPFSTWVGFDSEQVSWRGERAIYESSPTVKRGYCAACGTPLSYSGKKWAAETHLLIGTFDDARALTPTGDTFTKEKLPWTQLVGTS
jgi:hypothetical protein